MRRLFVCLFGVCLLLDLWPGRTEAAEPVVAIGSEPQLLLDDWLVARSDRLTRTLHPAQKQGLIRKADGSPWDRGSCYADEGNAVVRDNAGRFHMIYRYFWWDPSVRNAPSIGEDRAHWFRQELAYAYSDDGIRWHKPNLGLVDAPARFKRIKEFPFEVPDGMSRQNNLGCPIDFLYDLHANGNVREPGKRFLLRVVRKEDNHAFAKLVESQMYYAADWPDFARDPKWKDKLTPVPGVRLSPRGFKTITGYDHRAGQWIAFSQDYIGNWLKRGGRDVARFTSPDLVRWEAGEPVLQVSHDESRTPQDTVEYMSLIAYRVGGRDTGAWLGQLVVFHGDRSDPQYQMPTIANVWRKGTTEVRLVISRDAGRTWQWVGGKQAWLPCHSEDNGYDRLVFGSHPVRVGDEVWFYYSAWDGDHLTFNRDGTTYYKDRMRMARTARATLRLDGYASLHAGGSPGELVTKPLSFQGKHLVLNLSAPKGELRAELQDAAGKPLPGCTLTDCEPVTSDGVHLPVRWRAGADLSVAGGKTVRVRFVLRNADLYGFRFE